MSCRLGILGIAGRGGDLRKVIDLVEGLELTAACDPNPQALAKAAGALGDLQLFSDYDAMLGSGAIDAVLISTPMAGHAHQAIQALDAGIHVLSEVTACMDLEEAQALVAAQRRSTAVYAMAENYCYRKDVMVVEAMVQAGVFGTPYYAEGEYLHDCTNLLEGSWRRGIHGDSDGVTYPSHSLGPILRWFPGERVTEVMCVGSGRRHPTPEGDLYRQQAPCVMLCRMSGGGLVKIRVDLFSARPHAMHNYQLQGTDGAFDGMGLEYHEAQVWTRAHGRSSKEAWDHGRVWDSLRSMDDRYLPACWAQATPQQMATGHGGGDYFQFLDFLRAVQGGVNRLGLHHALDMTLPGIVSQRSIAEDGVWLPVPDSRSW